MQHIVFQDNDKGPLSMTPEEKGAKRHSQLDEPTYVAKTKANLLRDVQNPGVSMTRLKVNRFDNLQDLATLKNVETVKCVRKERVKVCMGKPKGLLQILWERGFIGLNVGARIY